MFVRSYITARYSPLKALVIRGSVLPEVRRAGEALQNHPDRGHLDPRWTDVVFKGLQAVSRLPGALRWSYFGIYATGTAYDDRRSIERKASAGRDMSHFLLDFVERDDIRRSDLVLLDVRSPS